MKILLKFYYPFAFWKRKSRIIKRTNQLLATTMENNLGLMCHCVQKCVGKEVKKKKKETPPNMTASKCGFIRVNKPPLTGMFYHHVKLTRPLKTKDEL